MEFIADLHVHSKFARGCSPKMDIAHMAASARRKGIHLVGTGDFTHPVYFEEIKQELHETGNGSLELKNSPTDAAGSSPPPLFVPTVELNNLFADPAGRKHRVHTLIGMPSLDAAARFSRSIAPHSKLGSDGRPWVRLSLADTVSRALEAHPEALVIPAHAWTPWYSIFGSKSGFDSLQAAFGDQTKRIHAIETGLSSDPPMNWRCSWLDGVRLVSFSDAHSPDKLGREATVFELGALTYANLFEALAKPSEENHVARTLEFFPQEGKYFADGHRECQVRFEPQQTREAGGRCPKCSKKLTVGVLNRIDTLADRPLGFRPPDAPGFTSLVPLRELIAMALDRGAATQGVSEAYDAMLTLAGDEFAALQMAPSQLEARYRESNSTLSASQFQAISSALERMQAGRLKIEPGFDGQFGVVGL